MLYSQYSRYIKKSDAEFFVKQQYRLIAIMLLFIVIAFGFIYFTVFSKMMTMYEDLGQLQPFLVRQFPYGFTIFSLVAVLSSVRFFTKEVDVKELNKKLSKYKQNEMILSNEVLDMKNAILVIGATMLFVLYMVFSIISPIYSITQ
ncbi:MAG TPA: hypothetical protein PKJ26_02070 [Candidatus Woesebacteria bacterium]|nr:hypothetical protein [Candidatus Woesebacteria bacterium]HNS65261.1 hypothetical protein [Candidatus Woesebacteria bacterium]